MRKERSKNVLNEDMQKRRSKDRLDQRDGRDRDHHSGHAQEFLHNDQNHGNVHISSIFVLWMLMDGIGLTMIAVSTVFEGVELWNFFLHEYWDSNKFSLILWFAGRTFQVTGLILLVAFAASFQTYPLIEKIGMFLLTTGPLINLVSCYLFHSLEDPLYLYNKQWRSNEIIEFTGMFILDLSYVETGEFYELLTELAGLSTLICAAVVEFDYSAYSRFPTAYVRWDFVHTSEGIGLVLLAIVAYGLYRIHVFREELQLQKDRVERPSDLLI